jgi:cyclophilin family peptidyl-prolyl cis-trans isomerase
MVTTLGTFDIQLYDDQAPKTVANFLRYAGRGDYTANGFIHRSAPGFVIQGGGYAFFIDLSGNPFFFHIPQDPPVQNEFSPSRSNVRGTIAMAKLGGKPDSATSEWFFNLADNSANLDTQNGGFTVFGNVIDPGMSVVDAIAALPISNQSAVNGDFGALPVINFDPTKGLQESNLVMLTSIPNVSAPNKLGGATSVFTADVDMTFTPDSVKTLDAATSTSDLATFTPPPNESVNFNDGIFTFTLTGAMPSGRVVTLLYGDTPAPNHYYAYGPTPDNTTPHWYEFSFDGTTGAEFIGNKILLHFVDGQRGDDDLNSTNGSITHTGAPVLVAPISSSSSSGCTIAGIPSQTTNNGDWVLISLFLTFVALVRRRAHHDRVQRATNIASP